MTQIREVSRAEFDAVGQRKETITLTIAQWEHVRMALLLAVARSSNSQLPQLQAFVATYEEIVNQGAAQQFAAEVVAATGGAA